MKTFRIMEESTKKATSTKNVNQKNKKIRYVFEKMREITNKYIAKIGLFKNIMEET